jgi:beta-glucanase (GH16 family)
MQGQSCFWKSGSLFPILIMAVFAVMFTRYSSSCAATAGWQFLWSDEFNGATVDESVWGWQQGDLHKNNEVQFYTSNLKNSRIDNGNLLIQAFKQDTGGLHYTSASRISQGKKSWKYGRFECRAKIDTRNGSWPAWWGKGIQGGWPSCGEIDMMEYYSGNCLLNVMNGYQGWVINTRSVSAMGGAWWTSNFHVWTMDWDSLKIDLFLDGVLVTHYPVANADGSGPGGINPLRQPFFMIINQALGGNGGDPSQQVFPMELRVDWVRIHTWANAAAYTLTVANGIGSGPYVAGTRASLTAKMPPSGQVFDKWVVNSGTVTITPIDSASATIIMPSTDVSVTATYKMPGTTRMVKPRGRAGVSMSEISPARIMISGTKANQSLRFTGRANAGRFYDVKGRMITSLRYKL